MCSRHSGVLLRPCPAHGGQLSYHIAAWWAALGAPTGKMLECGGISLGGPDEPLFESTNIVT